MDSTHGTFKSILACYPSLKKKKIKCFFTISKVIKCKFGYSIKYMAVSCYKCSQINTQLKCRLCIFIYWNLLRQIFDYLCIYLAISSEYQRNPLDC